MAEKASSLGLFLMVAFYFLRFNGLVLQMLSGFEAVDVRQLVFQGLVFECF